MARWALIACPSSSGGFRDDLAELGFEADAIDHIEIARGCSREMAILSRMATLKAQRQEFFFRLALSHEKTARREAAAAAKAARTSRRSASADRASLKATAREQKQRQALRAKMRSNEAATKRHATSSRNWHHPITLRRVMPSLSSSTWPIVTASLRCSIRLLLLWRTAGSPTFASRLCHGSSAIASPAAARPAVELLEPRPRQLARMMPMPLAVAISAVAQAVIPSAADSVGPSGHCSPRRAGDPRASRCSRRPSPPTCTGRISSAAGGSGFCGCG